MGSEIESLKYFDLTSTQYPSLIFCWKSACGLNPSIKLSKVSSEYFCQVFREIFSTQIVFLLGQEAKIFIVIMTMEDLFLYWYSRLITQYVVDGGGDIVLMSPQLFTRGRQSLQWPGVELTCLKYIVFRFIICGVWSRQHAYDIMTRRPLPTGGGKKHKAKTWKKLKRNSLKHYTSWKLKKFLCFVVSLGFYIRFVILDVCWSCIGYIRKSPFMGTLFWVAFNFPSRKKWLFQ